MAANSVHWKALITTKEIETTLQRNNCQFLPHPCFNICDIFFTSLRIQTLILKCQFTVTFMFHAEETFVRNLARVMWLSSETLIMMLINSVLPLAKYRDRFL